MKIEHQGWNDTVGTFHCDVIIDEHRTDYKIHFPDGSMFRQQTPFETMSLGPNQSDVPSGHFGAYFSRDGIAEFFTPLELASLVLNGYATIPGLRIEEHQENLADRIAIASQRAKGYSNQSSDAPSLSPVLPDR